MAVDIDTIVSRLVGTCMNLDDALEEQGIMILTMEETEELDLEAMQCETCSWWVEAHDIDEDGNCQECSDAE